ncbi:hypothetical protein ABVT39_009979 [Epinephelus coioides]
MEKENNSIMEVKKILNSIHTILLGRKSNNFMSLKVKGLLAEKRTVLSQWTKERNQLSVASLKGILFVRYNFKDYSCKDFHVYMLSNRKLLGKISSTAKYGWADKGDEEENQDEEEN